MSQARMSPPEGQTLHGGSNVAPFRFNQGAGSRGYRVTQEETGGDRTEMSNPGREEIDAKLSAVEARIEATVTRMEAKLDTGMARMEAKLAHLPSTWVLVTTAFTSFLATVAAMIGLLSYGGDRFDSGAVISSQMAETRALTNENARQIKDVSDRLDALPDRLLGAMDKRVKIEKTPRSGDAE